MKMWIEMYAHVICLYTIFWVDELEIEVIFWEITKNLVVFFFKGGVSEWNYALLNLLRSGWTPCNSSMITGGKQKKELFFGV